MLVRCEELTHFLSTQCYGCSYSFVLIHPEGSGPEKHRKELKNQGNESLGGGLFIDAAGTGLVGMIPPKGCNWHNCRFM